MMSSMLNLPRLSPGLADSIRTVGRSMVSDPGRFADQMLRNERVQHEQDYARDQKED